MNGTAKAFDPGNPTNPNGTAAILDFSKPSESGTATILNSDTQQDMVINLVENSAISQQVLKTLAKGPKFVITPRISRTNLQRIIEIEIAALVYAMRWHYTITNNTPLANNSTKAIGPSNISKICPFHNRRQKPPWTLPDGEKVIKVLQTDL